MKEQKTTAVILGVLLCMMIAAAALHAAVRERVPEGALLIVQNDEKRYLALDELALSEVRGIVVNGKGEEKSIQGMGISVAEALSAAGIDRASLSSLTVEADNSYSAELRAEELDEMCSAFLMKEEDGTMRLVVFGDSNAKRNVRNVSRMIVH